MMQKTIIEPSVAVYAGVNHRRFAPVPLHPAGNSGENPNLRRFLRKTALQIQKFIASCEKHLCKIKSAMQIEKSRIEISNPHRRLQKTAVKIPISNNS